MVEKIRCKKCGSSQVYFRFKTNEIVCRSCGNIQKKEDIKKEKEK